MGFKYGPEFRFFESRSMEKFQDADEEVKRVIPEILKQDLKEKLKMGEKVSESDIERLNHQYYNKAMDSVMELMSNKKELSKIKKDKKKEKKKKYNIDENGKRIRNNKDE